MALVLDYTTNQQKVLVFLKKDPKHSNERSNAVMLGIKYYLLDDVRWGKLVDSLNPPADESELDPGTQFFNTLMRHKTVVKKIISEVCVLEDLQFALNVSVLDADNKPVLDDDDDIKTKRVEASLKNGDRLEGENLEAILSLMAVVQQVFDYYSKNIQNVHQRDTDGKKK